MMACCLLFAAIQHYPPHRVKQAVAEDEAGFCRYEEMKSLCSSLMNSSAKRAQGISFKKLIFATLVLSSKFLWTWVTWQVYVGQTQLIRARVTHFLGGCSQNLSWRCEISYTHSCLLCCTDDKGHLSPSTGRKTKQQASVLRATLSKDGPVSVAFCYRGMCDIM